MTEHIVHPIPPLYDADSRVLILGSFPSVKSREAAFFYGHPQNRFWRVLFCNGTTASRLYERYLLPVTGMQAVRLPSTSPANASFSLDRLAEQWQAVAAYL